MRRLLLRSALGLGLLSQLPAGAASAPEPMAAAARPTLVRPVQGWGTGLTASYFNNGSLAGTPVLKRQDAVIDFRWGMKAPAPGLPADNFSVRWEGLIAASTTGRYRFVAVTTDEVRLWVNGKKVLDTWDGKKAGSLDDGSVTLAAGEKATIKLEYNDTEGVAAIQLQWVPPGQGAQLIPAGNLYPLGSPTTPDPAGAPPVAKAKVEPAAKEAKPAKVAVPAKPAKPVKEVAQATPKPAETPKPVEKPAKAPKPAPAEEKPSTELPGVYTLTVRSTGKPLEVAQGRPATLSEQMAATAEQPAAPQWRIEPAGEGVYRLVVPGSNKVLEVLGSATSNGTPLGLWSYYSGYNQQWRIEDVGDGYYKLTAKHSRKALTDKDTLGGGVQQWRYTGKDNQQWKLEPVKAMEEPILAGAPKTGGVGDNSMSVYPNPSNGVMQMAYSLNESKPLGWVLYNQNGVAVRVSDYRKQTAGSHHQTLNFTSLPAGDYYLSLTVGSDNTRQLVSIRRPSADVPEVGATSPK
ncbi:RICIN domain-containing protein [Hymenobacter rubripertinctus]|uniref:RICIN domain-containing protein n=1 Tax=Hymenobacter rubripertinctus TaxID=2029981 RepID=UPI001603224A|nr:PA14 domain-containing protein [Hymenobacter rubripertinctus]